MRRQKSRSTRSRRQQTRQITKRRTRPRLRKLEPDLHVAPVQIEFRNLMLLEEFNQLFQIRNILWFHSFLNSPNLNSVILSAAYFSGVEGPAVALRFFPGLATDPNSSSSSKLNQRFRRRCASNHPDLPVRVTATISSYANAKFPCQDKCPARSSQPFLRAAESSVQPQCAATRESPTQLHARWNA